MRIRRVEPGDWAEWLRMRAALWPDCPVEKHEQEMALTLSPPPPLSLSRVAGEGEGGAGRSPAGGGGEGQVALVAERPDGRLGGFIEVGLRQYAEGCDTSPVGYVEGWYVDPDLRRQGVGAALLRAGEAWARAQGCAEMASDCSLDNEASLRAHLGLGYEEAERLVHLRKAL